MGLLNTIVTGSDERPSHSESLSASADTTSAFDWMRDVQGNGPSAPFAALGDVRAEAAAALAQTVMAPLAHRLTIRAQGADVDSFLQGQLSNDIRELTPSRAQLSSYSNPKGRVLAVLTLLRVPEAVLLETEAELAPAILKRLRLYVLRAKLRLEIAAWTDAALGLSGPDAAALLERAELPVPAIVWGCAEARGIVVLRRPDGPFPRYSLHGTSVALAEVWARLAQDARPVGTQAWRLLDLLAGLPAIHADTSEQHVAQMLNLDQLDGISFAKGCYPGQEIIARLHYLGSLKRRLFLGYAEGSAVIPRATPVFAADAGPQPVGEVLESLPHPSRGLAVQLVLQIANRESPLRIGTPDGPALVLA